MPNRGLVFNSKGPSRFYLNSLPYFTTGGMVYATMSKITSVLVNIHLKTSEYFSISFNNNQRLFKLLRVFMRKFEWDFGSDLQMFLLFQRENLELFLKGCEKYGMKSQDLFQVNDLYENKNLYMVSKYQHYILSLKMKFNLNAFNAKVAIRCIKNIFKRT